jgi:hypothetical protein
MKKIFCVFIGSFLLVGCSHQLSTETGQSEFYNYFHMCAHSRNVLERFNSYSELTQYCGCRARYLAQNTTFAEHRDMVRAEFETGLTVVSQRVMNDAENSCNKQ